MSDLKDQKTPVEDAELNDSIDIDKETDAVTNAEGDSDGATEELSNTADLDPVVELAAAQEEIVKLKDAFLRAKAEEDNVRRRSEKEMANSRKFAVENFAKEMLNVRDSLKLASTNDLADDADDSVKSIYEGVALTLKQLDAVFAKFALVGIAPESGDKLDPNLHQAMTSIETEDVDSGCVVNVIQTGFTLHDRLLRPAMVVVAK